jgi:hypothetical protein
MKKAMNRLIFYVKKRIREQCLKIDRKTTIKMKDTYDQPVLHNQNAVRVLILVTILISCLYLTFGSNL